MARQAQRNPGKQADPRSIENAAKAWKIFHKKSEPRKIIPVQFPWPANWALAGRSVTVYYSSDKWKRDGDFERYYHDHDRGTRIWHPAGTFPWLDEETRSPAASTPEAVAVLGYCLGVDVKRHDTGKVQRLDFEKKSLLVTDPAREFLWVVEPSAGVVALIEGAALTVEGRGIVG